MVSITHREVVSKSELVVMIYRNVDHRHYGHRVKQNWASPATGFPGNTEMLPKFSISVGSTREVPVDAGVEPDLVLHPLKRGVSLIHYSAGQQPGQPGRTQRAFRHRPQ